MTLERLKELLDARAKACLVNAKEISNEALDVATRETIEEIGGRKVKERAIMDFAMTRLRVYLKIALSEEDEMLYKAALEEIRRSPTEDLDGDKRYGFLCVEREANLWVE